MLLVVLRICLYVLLAIRGFSGSGPQIDILEHVNPLIGTRGDGEWSQMFCSSKWTLF